MLIDRILLFSVVVVVVMVCLFMVLMRILLGAIGCVGLRLAKARNILGWRLCWVSVEGNRISCRLEMDLS